MREFEILSKVYQANSALPGWVAIPPGDDMGGLLLGDGVGGVGGEQILVTVDQVADGVHVDLANTSLERIGRKAITRNLSDVAAMGAVPLGAVVAASLPKNFGQDRALSLLTAIQQTGQAYQCPLIGGDTSIWHGRLLLSVTILAKPAPNAPPILRQGSQVGDILCVSGQLGGSLQHVHGYIHHLDFEPRLALGQRLASDATIRPHAMLDLSDGLARDITHLLQAPQAPTPTLGARIDIHHLPLSAGAKQAALMDGVPAWQHALIDGEDYELCFTMAPEKLPALLQANLGVPITAIGHITATPGVLCYDEAGQHHPLQASGWEHHGS